LLAFLLPRETVFLLALVVPAISVIGVFMIQSETTERRPIDWRILGGGLVFGAVVALLGLGGVPFAQEIIFIVSMGVVCGMLVFVTRDLDHKSRMIILYAAIIIFAFRSTPSVGDGYGSSTYQIDEAFCGAADRRSDRVTSGPGRQILSRSQGLFFIAVAGSILSLPSVGHTTASRIGPTDVRPERAHRDR
jgi:hypothetical protein